MLLACVGILYCSSTLKGTLSPKTIFQYVREAWPLITVAYFFSSRTFKIERNLQFPRNSRDSVCLRIGDRKRKVYLKRGDRKRILLSKVGTGKELCISEMGPEIFFRSPVLRSQFFSGPSFQITILFRSPLLRVTFFLVLSFEIHFSFPVPYSETHNISRVSGKIEIYFYS